MDRLPVIDVGPLVGGPGDPAAVGAAIDAACREVGFFYVVGHGVDPDLCRRVEAGARALFALPEADKRAVAMARGGRAWRGWFPLGGELTAGVPDGKEGFYLGAELPPDDPRVRAGTPLHGPNLVPDGVPGLRDAVLAYLDALTDLGQALLAGMALGLGLDAGWFRRHLTADPLVLLRFFRYPPSRSPASAPGTGVGADTGRSARSPAGEAGWGVAEHTDYGLLTVLAQDDAGGLEVHGPGGWVEAPPVPGSFVCNLGDMLERLTGGRYRSTPHRVRTPAGGGDRVSIPFFLDPGWEAEVVPVPVPVGGAPAGPVRRRWDGTDLAEISGTYGDYLLAKVRRVFPDLFATVVDR